MSGTSRPSQETPTTATARQPRQLQRRRIIERPRLLALLDESRARVRMLVAPAGYGKTTLAEQWVTKNDRRAAWYTARRSSTDVAALALGVARASTELVEGCDLRLREHLRALPAPAENVEVLAEILSEDLEAWSTEHWLVLDDYHEVARSEAAERFVAALVAGSPVQVLLAGRVRPAWVPAREILYGEFLELNQTELAMDSVEAAEMLSDRSPNSAAGLVALANGWPAVIGLAAVSGAEIDARVEQVPDSLYRFFAEEVYAALQDRVREGLATLATAPVLDHELAASLLGDARAEHVCDAGLHVGILVERGSQLEIHPLCRSFLDERNAEAGLTPSADDVARCLDHYRTHGDWDAAFDLLVRVDGSSELADVLARALDDLLDTARLSTLEEWFEVAAGWHLHDPILSLARAEVALRRGRHAEAQAHAEAAAEATGSDVVFRSLCVAGRAAHLGSREEKGLELYRYAAEAASTDAEARDAAWGQLRCQVDLELPEALTVVEDLCARVRFADVREVVRAAGHRLHLRQKFGSLDLADADLASELLSSVEDPLVSSSFQSAYSGALALSARYGEALTAAADLLSTADRYRLDFAVPYGLCSQALAAAGLRRWALAHASVDEALAIARRNRDRYVERLGFSILTRLLVQQGRHGAALGLDVPALESALPAARAEVLASRALVLATTGRVGEALTAMRGARDITQAVEAVVLLSAVDAVCAMRSHDSEAVDRVRELERVAFQTGGLDILVVAYRSNPDLLALMLRTSLNRDRLAALVRRVGDADVASAAGFPVSFDADPRVRLTAREREVYELLLTGLSNQAIAKALYISESTAKRHVHNIYGKLGLHSRAALIVQATLERSQATSAIDEGNLEASSDVL